MTITQRETGLRLERDTFLIELEHPDPAKPEANV